MKKILLIILSVYLSANLSAQITAKEMGVLAIPTYFDTYMTESSIKKVFNEEVSLNELIKDNSSPLPWIVYSDRSKNAFLTDFGSNGIKDGTLSIAVPLVVYSVKGSWLEVGTVPIRENKKFVHDKKGWMRADQLILSPYAIVGESGPRKGMILTSVNSFDKTDDVMKILENKYYFRGPDLKEKSKNKAKKFQFLFIIKETNDAFLLSKTDNLSKSVNSSQSNIRGWLPKGKVTKWNHRVCLEPSSDKKVVAAYAGKTIYVIDNEAHYKTYLEQGSLPNKDWAIREIELKNRRPFAYQMRMPILPDWDGQDRNNKKVAAIAQMLINDGDDDEMTEEEKKDKEKVTIDKEQRLGFLKTSLAETKERQNKINILFVLDGTKSMELYGPAVSRSIEEFMKIRDSKFSDDNYQFALAVYRHYEDEGETPPLFKYIPFTGTVKQIQEKLEKLKYDSKNTESHEESHYYGMINAIKEAKFNKKETNIVVLIGDAGNERKDARGLKKEEIINLLYKNNISLISFQVNYQRKPAYMMFNADVYSYLKLLGNKYVSKTKHFTSTDFVSTSVENTFKLKFNAIDNSDQEEMYPIFGKFKYAEQGSSMDVKIFENNLTSSLDDYANSLSILEVYLTKLIEDGLKEKDGSYTPDVSTGEDEDEVVFTKGFEEYLRRLGYSDEAIEMLKRQGEISAQGFLSLKMKGIEEDAFVPVIFISKEYKDILSDKLDRIAGASGKRGSEARKIMYNAIVSVMKSIMGDEVSSDKIDKLTFNEVWMQILGVPFSGNTQLKNMKIYQIKTEMDDEEFLDFYSDFAEDVEDFKKWDVTDKYSMWKKAGQTYYWIPLSEVPGCE